MSTPSWSESAFGVVHKSYIPGRGYKAASKLTPYERNKVRAGSPPRKKGDAKDNKLWGTKPPKGIEIQRASFPGPRGNQGQSRFDGRGNGKIQLFQGGNNETTLKHEMAHVTPRRNPVHLLERTKNPVRNGREEGRADFLAHGGATPGRYRGKNEFQRGYNQVQQKMANAKNPISKAVPVRHLEAPINWQKIARGTKTVHAARGKKNAQGRYIQPDMSVHDFDGSFFRKPKRVIAAQDDHTIKYTVYGGGMTGKGKATLGAAAVGTVGGAGYAAGKKKH